MARQVLLTVLAAGVAAAALGGCTDIKRAIGIEKVVPDEFAVVSRAPLALPPDYSLRPPQPGAPPTQEVAAQDQARQAVFRGSTQQQAALPPAAGARSGGEGALLREAGVSAADPHIREVVTEDQQATPEGGKSFVDRLLFWRSPSKPDQTLDPTKEAERIREAQAAGRPVAPDAIGATAQTATPSNLPAPTIERKKSTSLIGSFF